MKIRHGRMHSSILLLAVSTIAMYALAFPVSPACGVTAGRYWSDGTGGEIKSFWSTDAAVTWIQEKAKGYVDNLGGYSMDLVVLRDRVTYHHTDVYWRGPGYPYYNAWDPYYKSLDIQYTLRYMGHSYLTADNYYGPLTTSAVKVVQANNGITQDGITGPATYEKLATRTR